MMTQVQNKAQVELEEFNVIALEEKLAADYEKAQKPISWVTVIQPSINFVGLVQLSMF